MKELDWPQRAYTDDLVKLMTQRYIDAKRRAQEHYDQEKARGVKFPGIEEILGETRESLERNRVSDRSSMPWRGPSGPMPDDAEVTSWKRWSDGGMTYVCRGGKVVYVP